MNINLLTQKQLEVIITAMFFVHAGMLFTAKIDITEVVPIDDPDGDQGLRCFFDLKMEQDNSMITIGQYVLAILYYNTMRQESFETIALGEFVDPVNVKPASLGRVGYVVDKLREYGYWEKSTLV